MIESWIAGHIPGNRDLTRPELRELAGAIVAERALWNDHVQIDEAERHFVHLHRDPNLDVWIICWSAGQGTGYHDHEHSKGAVYVCDGAVVEDFYHRGEDGCIRERTNRYAAGEQFDFDAFYIHGVRYAEGQPAVTVHCYSPPLWRMGHYETNENGILHRTSTTYEDESPDHNLSP
ncbi:MAG: cysteine dioxygenase family protein [Thermoleophilia bacterium]